MLDLVEGGATYEEVVYLAKAVEAAGATIVMELVGMRRVFRPSKRQYLVPLLRGSLNESNNPSQFH